MKTLKIDEKWSVEYDPANNDRLVNAMANGNDVPMALYNINHPLGLAMFRALLEARENATRADHQIENRLKEGGKAF